MNNSKELFDKDTISYINQFVESKDELIKDAKDFKEKDDMLCLYMEDLENKLSKENKEKFDKVIKLMYQVEEYYIALAYMLGSKYGNNIEKL